MGFQFVSSGNAWLRCCCFLHPMSWLPFVFLKFTVVFQSSFLNILALRTWLRIEKWYFRNHAIITPQMATHRERLAGFLVHRCIHVGPGWPRVFRRLIQGSQNCIFWKKSSLQDFFVPVEIRFNIHLALCSQTRSSTTNLNMVKIAFWSSLSQNRDSNSFPLLMDVILACRPSVLEQQKKTVPHV